MKRMLLHLPGLLVLVLALTASAADKKPGSPKEALQAFNELIGSWRGTGSPETGTTAEKRKNFWQETVAWDWQFKGDDCWLNLTFTKGKYFDKGTLRYLADKDVFRLELVNTDKDKLLFDGKLDDKKRVLTLEREDDKKKEAQRLVITMLHETRFLYRYETKPTERQGGFTKQYQVGSTREGIQFAAGDGKPECIVSGGLGTMKISYKGKDYYICCSGCRDAFKDDPEKYIKEFEEKKKKK